MSKFLSLFVCCILLQSLCAQNNCLQQLDKEGIYLRTDFWRGTTMVKGTQSKSVGFFFRQIEPEFNNFPIAQKMFKKAQKDNKIAFAAGMVGLAGIMAGLILNTSAIDSDGNITNHKKFDAGNGIMLGSAVLTLAVAVPFRARSDRKLADAVWQRNREMMQ